MTNVAIQILVLIIFLLNVGVVLTAKIYSKSIKDLKRNRLFCSKSLSNPYCITF